MELSSTIVFSFVKLSPCLQNGWFFISSIVILLVGSTVNNLFMISLLFSETKLGNDTFPSRILSYKASLFLSYIM